MIAADGFGRTVAESFVLGMVEGLGHSIADGRCVHCGDAYDAIRDRIAGSRTEHLLFGELRQLG